MTQPPPPPSSSSPSSSISKPQIRKTNSHLPSTLCKPRKFRPTCKFQICIPITGLDTGFGGRRGREIVGTRKKIKDKDGGAAGRQRAAHESKARRRKLLSRRFSSGRGLVYPQLGLAEKIEVQNQAMVTDRVWVALDLDLGEDGDRMSLIFCRLNFGFLGLVEENGRMNFLGLVEEDGRYCDLCKSLEI